MSLSQLSKQLLRLRKEHKMTQGSLANRVGVSTTAISQFENGANRPSLETLTKLSEVLGEDLRELVPSIGRFPILSTENNVDVPIIDGSLYNRLKWKNLADTADAVDAAISGTSQTAFAYESLSLPPSLLETGQHIVYPISNSKMSPTFEEGDFLLCSLVEDREEWVRMGADTDNLEAIEALSVYVVEVWGKQQRTIHCGRFSINEKKQTLRCYPDDRSIPYRIPLADIKGVWKFRWCLTKRAHNTTQELLGRIRKLEYELTELRGGESSIDHPTIAADFRTFRERLRDIIIGQRIVEGEFLVGDYIDLANDNEVQELYAREYGPIQNHRDYMKSLEPIILNMVRLLAPEVQEAIAKEGN